MDPTKSASDEEMDSNGAVGSELSTNQPEGATVLRILAVCNTRFGNNDASYVDAFRRAGHCVLEVAPEMYFPRWKSIALRMIRRLLAKKLVGEFNSAIIENIRDFKPHLFFVFKGESVHPDAICFVKDQGAIAINFWPDVSFRAHGALPPQAMPKYDWIFNSKSFGLEDLEDQIGVVNASFLPHAFDTEVHRPVEIDSRRDADLVCDVSFIGNWSPKKEAILAAVAEADPAWSFRIWGSDYWKRSKRLENQYEGHPVLGQEYARAICASRINICILSEKRAGSSSGDLTTARTFELAGAGGFMLHERTREAMRYFEDGKECVFFDGADDLIAKIRYYLAHEDERRAIAVAGRRRALMSGYSYDDRVATVIAKYHELRAAQGKGKA